ncbi:hypothetical protein [Rhizobium leucaenae]|uniref:hypothetical protein n=1 Tax=Rhizobium leucaenae TaxID=29450 RepID=UPI0016126432|nr:hypothetical protein [Rhizobium leucaenae]MBB6305094.1 hypothetical protein [Rhizobium leucaenae]
MSKLIIEMDEDGNLIFRKTLAGGQELEAFSAVELDSLIRKIVGLESEEAAQKFREKIEIEIAENRRVEVELSEEANSNKLVLDFIDSISRFNSISDFQNDIANSYSQQVNQLKI